MTPKDLRDIAAYVGCTFTVSKPIGYFVDPVWGFRIDSATMEGIHLLRMLLLLGNEKYKHEAEQINLKLHLRLIASLTDEEVFTLAGIAFDGEVDRTVDEIRRPHWNGDDPILYLSHFLRTDGGSGHYDYWISDRGLFGSGDGGDGSEIATYNEAAVFAYLQSISVYVPGTINPDYVELQP